MRRIDEWLAEGIDIDRDGQYTERSTLTYNIVTDRAFVVMAAKLKRPALLDPVRQNLRALTYLLHADGEVVTEISRRQDQFTRGGLAGYWFTLTYMAVADRDGVFATMARQAADGVRLSALLEYPELSQPLPASQPLPSDYEKIFSEIGIARIRRGPLSATLALGGSSRVLSLRYGDAVVEGVRFATSFFGKGQFVPLTGAKEGSAYLLPPVARGAVLSTAGADDHARHVGADAARAAADRDQSPRAGRRGHRNEVRVSGSRERPLAPLAFRSRSRSPFATVAVSRAARPCRERPAVTCWRAGQGSTVPERTRSDSVPAPRHTDTFSSAGQSPSCPDRASTSPASRRSIGR